MRAVPESDQTRSASITLNGEWVAITRSSLNPDASRGVRYSNAINRLDEIDGDADLEPEVTEQDDEREMDDEAEEDDHGGGDVGDEGEGEEGRVIPAYRIDQTTGPLPLHAH